MKLSSHNSVDDWQPCRPGMICDSKTAIQNEIRFSRRALMVKLAGLGSVGILVGGVSFFGWIIRNRKVPANLPAAIGCVQVHEHLAAYVANKITDKDLKARMALHLSKCLGCQRVFQDLRCHVDDCCSHERTCPKT